MIEKQEREKREEITKNLTSFEFGTECEVDDDLIALRTRSHATTVNIVAHVCYYVAVLNEIHRKLYQENKISDHTEVDSFKRLKIGLIGCGRLGSHILKGLLEYSDVIAEDMVISTRRPEMQLELQEKKIVCCSDNQKVAASSDFVILSCLPSQVDNILMEIKGHIAGFLYTVVSSYKASKIRKLTGHLNVYKPVYSYCALDDLRKVKWNFDCGVVDNLACVEFREKTCPLHDSGETKPVQVDTKFIETLLFFSVNKCLEAGMSKFRSLEIATGVIFRSSGSTELFQEYFQDGRFDLLKIENEDTTLTAMLRDPQNSLFIEATNRYKSVFDRFYDWRTRHDRPYYL